MGAANHLIGWLQARLRARMLGAESCLDAGVADLPGAEKEPDLEPCLVWAPTAGTGDPARIRADPVREAAVARERAHQVREEPFVTELEPQGHVPVIVGDASRLLPP